MAIHARIFRPTRTATQQGGALTHEWVLEFAPSQRRLADPLMGCVSSGDTRSQIRLRFQTREEAESYAKQNGIAFEVHARASLHFGPKDFLTFLDSLSPESTL